MSEREEQHEATVKHEKDGYWKRIEIFADLIGLNIALAKQICKDLGVDVQDLPDVKLGYLKEENSFAFHHYENEAPYGHVKSENGFVFFPFGIPQTQKLDKTLIIESFCKEESFLRYAEMVRDEFKNYSDEAVKNVSSLGHKSWSRAQDELLRRGLIRKGRPKDK